MSVDETPDLPEQAAEGKTPGSTTLLAQGLLQATREDRARDERQTLAAMEAMRSSYTMLMRVTVALVVVLGILVAGVVGVGVTGTVPGVGEIKVVQPGQAAPEPTP